MKFHTIADILAAQRRAHDRFSTAVSGLNEAQLHFRPAAEEWTIAEIAEHVSIVNGGMLRITHKLLKLAEAEPAAPAADLSLGYTFPADNPPPKFQAPDGVRPKGGVSIPDALANIQKSLDGFDEIRARLEAVDLSKHEFPHPALGPITAYRWMILMGEHQDLHRRQIERIKAAAGYPA